MPGFRISVLATFVFMGLGSLPLAARQYQFSNSIFTMPAGWELRDNTLYFQTISPEDSESCGYCRLHIARSHPALGGLKSFVSRNKRLFLDPDDDNLIERLQPLQEIEEAGYQVVMQSFTVDDTLMFLIGFQAGERFELLGFQGDADDEAALQATVARFSEIVPDYLSTVVYVSEGAAPLMPPPQPGPYDGAWFGTYVVQSVGADLMMRMDMYSNLYIFWPDGYFHYGTPRLGLVHPDPDSLREPIATDYGTYHVEGDQVILSFANGETESLTVDGEYFQDGQATLSRVTPLPDGSTIKGTISSSYASGFGGIGMMSQGGFNSSSSTTFAKDGTYTGESSSASFGSFSDGMGNFTGGFGAGNQDNEAGTYEIRNGMIYRQPVHGADAIDPELIFDWDGTTYIGQTALETE